MEKRPSALTLQKISSLLFQKRKITVLTLPLTAYLMVFFIPISSNLHNNMFYLAVLLPFLLVVEKSFLFRIFASRIVVLTILFAFYLVFRTFFYTPDSLAEAFDYVRYFFSFCCFFIISVALFEQSDFRLNFNYVALWALFWGCFSIVFFYRDHGLGQRLQLYASTDHLIIAACLYAAIGTFALFPPRNSLRMLITMAGVLLFVCVALSGSHGPLLATVLAVLAGHLRAGRKWALIFPLILVVGVWISHYFGFFAIDRIVQMSSGYRLDIWGYMLEDIWRNGQWLFGNSLLAEAIVTIGTKTFAHAHSGYFGTFFYGGLFGLLLLIALMVVSGRHVWLSGENGNHSLKTALWVFALLIITTDSHKLLDAPGPLWLYFWMPLAYLGADELRYKGSQNGF